MKDRVARGAGLLDIAHKEILLVRDVVRQIVLVHILIIVMSPEQSQLTSR